MLNLYLFIEKDEKVKINNNNWIGISHSVINWLWILKWFTATFNILNIKGSWQKLILKFHQQHMYKLNEVFSLHSFVRLHFQLNYNLRFCFYFQLNSYFCYFPLFVIICKLKFSKSTLNEYILPIFIIQFNYWTIYCIDESKKWTFLPAGFWVLSP